MAATWWNLAKDINVLRRRSGMNGEASGGMSVPRGVSIYCWVLCNEKEPAITLCNNVYEISRDFYEKEATW